MDSADSTLVEASRPAEQPVGLEGGKDAQSGSFKRQRDPPNLVDPQPIVEVHVISPFGHTKTYRVHQNFICYYSPFFDAAFNGNFTEGNTRSMKLEDTSTEAFGIFVNWLYTGDIENNKRDLPSCEALIHLWLLADLVLVPRLQNEAMWKLEEARLLRKRLPSSVLARAYEHTSKGSPLRRYIVRTWPNIRNCVDYDKYPLELLVDIINSPNYRACSTTGRAMTATAWKERELPLGNYFVNEEECSVREQRVAEPETSERMAKKRRIEEAEQPTEKGLSCA
ncbi:hypothetical protein BGZ57DRAFT_373241 [Hyaloscypha finlandica]|nr:hypothetical protein BGZ57DRAFT_373241 [Hyaloscypha finlandica]